MNELFFANIHVQIWVQCIQLSMRRISVRWLKYGRISHSCRSLRFKGLETYVSLNIMHDNFMVRIQ
jgi:hypothetical protein